MTTATSGMRRIRRTAIAGAAVAAAGAIALTGCSSSHDGHSAGGSSSVAAASSTHDDADATFVQTMIPHHEQAVEMADMLLAKSGVDARVVSLAREIKDAQAPEIATMRGWASSWGVSATEHASMDHGSMSGTMSVDDMNRLRSAQGVEAARLFLDQMIVHHTGAIAMAQNEIRDGSDPAATQLARSIVTTQQREIATMRQLLSEL
ncbi:MAG: DUF305 domain-containing protein [Gordonia paraffinivorans]